MKKDMLQLAREELQRLGQSIRDCSDRLMELSPLDIETARLRAAIMGTTTPAWFTKEPSAGWASLPMR